MRKRPFRDYSDLTDEPDVDADLEVFEHFDKRRHAGRRSDDNGGHRNDHRTHKEQRRQNTTTQRY